MIDVDMVAQNGLESKRLNERVERNRERLPADTQFQLPAAEKAEVIAFVYLPEAATLHADLAKRLSGR